MAASESIIPFVHVHIENVGAALHLVPRHRQRAVEIVRQNQFRKFWRAGDVGAFADDDEPKLGGNVQRLEPGKS